MISNVVQLISISGDHRPRPGDVMISFLPLAHMLERCCENGIYYSGAAVGFYSGNITDLTSDLKALKPTIMTAVPRLLNRIYDKDQAVIARSRIRRFIHNMAIKSKEGELKRGILRKNSIWDKLVFKKTQDGNKLSLLEVHIVINAYLIKNELLYCSIWRQFALGIGRIGSVEPQSTRLFALRTGLCSGRRLWPNRMWCSHHTDNSWRLRVRARRPTCSLLLHQGTPKIEVIRFIRTLLRLNTSSSLLRDNSS